MNVTERGYFTSEYLENVNRRSHRLYEEDERPHFKKLALAGITRQLEHKPSQSSLQQPKTTTRNVLGKGPAASSVPPSPVDSSKVFPISPESQLTASEASEAVDPIEYDPDELQQELTPAQLNVLQKQNAKPRRRYRRRLYYDDDSYYDDESRYDRHSDMYDKYYNREHILHQVPRQTRNKPTKQQKPKGGNYYIQQKKLYDEAEFVKPTIYTHKTFKEVFEDSHEDDKQFNPMVYVFDDPEKVREQEQKEKLKNAFKTLRVKLGKDDYQNYDYYNNNNGTKSNTVNEIFVHENASDSEDELGTPGNPQVFRSDADAQMAKKKSKFRTMWKKKVKKAKKELGKNYKENLETQWDLEDEIKRQKELAALNKHEEDNKHEPETNEPIITEPEDETTMKQSLFYGGPNSEFHPLWNYILSWLVYEKGPQPQPQAQSKQGPDIVDITGSTPKASGVKALAKFDRSKQLVAQQTPTRNKTRKIRVSAAQLKNFNKNFVKNYKGLKSKWNMPAADFFANAPEVATVDQLLPQSVLDIHRSDDNSQEFIIELDDDVSSVDEELYYNPHTGQLQREPPTSFSSMDEADRMLSTFSMKDMGSRMSTNMLMGANESAKGIVSNINALIKSIRIMKIIFAPIDIIAESFPNLQTVVIMVELLIFMWLLYELSLLIDALCMMVKAVCAPMIAMGRLMNRIM